MVDRRAFMKSGALALFAAGVGGVPTFIARAASSRKIIAPYKKNKVLVCIFQRGAMDGLMAVSPYSDPNLKALRPTLYMSPAETEGKMVDLDGRFGLHPSLAAFAPYFTEGRMAIVHGVGSRIPPAAILMRRIIWRAERHSVKAPVVAGLTVPLV